ncbi:MULTISPECIES: YdcF family protein [Microbacterium]|uniref:YdcF family protein n=1 Tax=Microbacterium TaxID=33882 RepID=UPI001E52A3E5|nr:YdcF family protein [Microbacterium nymphoidis]MCD2497433.1 YdcF family protein [Microbacterium nymphoidis]
MGSGRKLLGGGSLLIALAALGWGQWEAWRATGRHLGTATVGSRSVVIVLGFGNRGGRANLINRWRVRAGLRTLRSMPVPRALIVSGGRVHSDTAEAEILAAEARRQGWRGVILREAQSRSTAENIAFTAPLLRSDDLIAIVSDPVHAVRARAMLLTDRPELGARLVRGREWRFGERPLVTFVAAVRSRWHGRRR